MLKNNKKIKKIKLQFLKNKSLSSCVKLDKKSFPHTFKNFKIVESKRANIKQHLRNCYKLHIWPFEM